MRRPFGGTLREQVLKMEKTLLRSLGYEHRAGKSWVHSVSEAERRKAVSPGELSPCGAHSWTHFLSISHPPPLVLGPIAVKNVTDIPKAQASVP